MNHFVFFYCMNVFVLIDVLMYCWKACDLIPIFPVGYLSEPGPSNQDGMASASEILQLIVYTAAETNGHQFIHVLFGTSVGRAVFSHYRDRSPLPEDIARDNNHHELAEYLEEVHQR